ncbi:MAG: ABC transporter permease, partial [Bacteroidota bacterium]
MLLKHYLKMAFRNFRRHRSSFLINLTGLSTGLACALLISLWVVDELRMDQFHEKDDRLFKVMEHQKYTDRIGTTSSTPGILSRTLRAEFPDFEHVITVMWRNRFTLSKEHLNYHFNGHFVSPDFFHVFTFPLVIGDADEVLKERNACVLSVSAATKLFGSPEQAVGQIVELNHAEETMVTGIFEDPPGASSMKFDVVFNYDKFYDENEWLHNWGSNSPPSFAILKEGAHATTVSAKIADFIKTKEENSNVTLFLKKFSDHYLYGRYENGKPDGGRIEYVRLFSMIAIFILLIACINFMNLSTARASRRAKEVGVKKAVGAERQNLIGQYLSESVMVAMLSLMVAMMIVWLFLPSFNELTDKQLTLDFKAPILAGFLGITLLTGLIAGSYPALYLSSFNPVTVLKGSIQSSWGELWARRGLVVFQFTLSIIFIVSVIVIYQQIKYVQEKSMGYDRENLMIFRADGAIDEKRSTFLQEARRIPGVKSISASSTDMLGSRNNTSGLNWPGKDPDLRILFENVSVDYGLLETMGVELKEGRFFSEEFGADTSKIIFNEAAIAVMGLENPIGETIRLWDEHDLEIVGVVKDFHFQSMHNNVRPLFFRYQPDRGWNVLARLEAGRESEAIEGIQAFYEKFNPGFPFDYQFMDQEYAELYAAEQRVSGLSRYFAGFAILISCLGLFGLAAFTADRKRKEIGIRKVLGASPLQIISLLTKDFTRLVFVAILIGLPLAWYFTSHWLER